MYVEPWSTLDKAKYAFNLASIAANNWFMNDNPPLPVPCLRPVPVNSSHCTLSLPGNLSAGNVSTEPLNLDSDPFVKVAILGHSFISRLGNEMSKRSKRNDHTLQEEFNLRGSRILPYIDGQPGARIEYITELSNLCAAEFPQIIIVDIGQNDLCWSYNTPKELAIQLYSHIKLMFETHDTLELVAICQVTYKTKLLISDKLLGKFCQDVDEFNYQMLRLTRNDFRIMRWKHRGLSEPTKPFTTDGTHPNSISGFWKYLKSISSLCRDAKIKMLERRNQSKNALRQKYRKQRTMKRVAANEKQACKGIKKLASVVVPVIQPLMRSAQLNRRY